MKVNNMNIKSSIMTDNKYISSLFKWSVLFRRRARKFAFKRNLFSLKNKKIRLKRLGFSSFFFSFFRGCFHSSLHRRGSPSLHRREEARESSDVLATLNLWYFPNPLANSLRSDTRREFVPYFCFSEIRLIVISKILQILHAKLRNVAGGKPQGAAPRGP